MSVKLRVSVMNSKSTILILAVIALLITFAPRISPASSGSVLLSVTVSQFPKDVPAGDAVLIKLIPNVDATKITGECYGQSVHFFKIDESVNEYYAFVGTDVNEKEPTRKLTLTLTYDVGVTHDYDFDLKVKSVKYPEEKLTVDSKMVEPPKEEDKRIKQEREAVLKVYDTSRTKPHFDSEFKMPLTTQLSSTFGRRRVLNGIKKSPHSGLDFRGKTGTPVKASNVGQVVMAQDLYFTGNTVLIDHGIGLFTAYFHLSDIYKDVGEEVKRGEEIGAVGMTGRSTGPHLHFGVKLNGFYVNPLSVLSLSERLFSADEKTN